MTSEDDYAKHYIAHQWRAGKVINITTYRIRWVGKFRVAQLFVVSLQKQYKILNATKKDTSLIFAGYHDIEKNHPICVSR